MLRCIVFRVVIAWLAGFHGSVACAGYSHYFTWCSAPHPQRLQDCIAEMNQIVQAERAFLAGPDGKQHPIVGNDRVYFNGVGDDACEPFLFPGSEDIDFRSCKTNFKRYDAVVTACLIVAHDHFPSDELIISSDGDWDDWSEGASLYERVLHRSAKPPFGWSLGQEDDRGSLFTKLRRLCCLRLWRPSFGTRFDLHFIFTSRWVTVVLMCLNETRRRYSCKSCEMFCKDIPSAKAPFGR